MILAKAACALLPALPEKWASGKVTGIHARGGFCLDFAWENGKYTAAICAGPTVLADLGITVGRRATCYPGCEEQMGGATMVCSAAVTDGKLITGTSAGCAVPFGLALVAALRGQQAADAVEKQIVIR